MRHLKTGRKLGRNAEHRVALMRNLARALIEHERIITTVEKAKEARRFVEPLITFARKAAKASDPAQKLHYRRLALAKLGPVGKTTLYDKDDKATEDTVLKRLFTELGPRFIDRPGGYTRIIKRHERRLGDAGQTAFLELLKAGETKVKSRKPAPRPAAPRIEPEPKPEEAPAKPVGPAAEAPKSEPPAEGAEQK
jgi:large subunit ribosomal protein L17